MNKNTYKAHLALLGANVIYGMNHIIAKDVMPEKLGPTAFIFLRILGASLLFWTIKSFIKEKIDKEDYFRLIVCGILGIAINQLLYFHGLNLTSPIDASIIYTSVPVLVLIFSYFLLKEQITRTKILGIAIGGTGALLLILYGNKNEGTSTLLGNGLIFSNAIFYAFYLVYVKPLMKKYQPITVISWVFLIGFLFMIPFGLNSVINTNFSAFTLNTYLIIAFVIIGTTFLTYLFNIYALTKVPPSVNGSYIYLQPVVSFVMVSIYAFVLGKNEYAQDINLTKIISSILVIAGVYLISKKE
ncbi:Permease of the drug/metabolite transporter (DMT) superfamily [Lutibacter agarilyticus]|uniref:Permease of the drug/metabolite transporter (DMT) superfamily n=1 Tax=Lutibacter agarilyticus TaxID=1109740 RepID=A0A238VW13_9FLAO|nr:DMT family transporter [Lutibacter agarilyticus]SNR37679.1 Permease of the drug/metabolite transporter (DMT) superfamily [Lutibacter agarilyticus]